MMRAVWVAVCGLGILAVTGAAPAAGGGVVIDHVSANWVDGYSQAIMDAIGQQRHLFLHASIGDDITGGDENFGTRKADWQDWGLAKLHATDPARYQLAIQTIPAATYQIGCRYPAPPPATTTPGRFYTMNRANPTANTNIDCFEQTVSSSITQAFGYAVGGWDASKVDVVMNKLCGVDMIGDKSQRPPQYQDTPGGARFVQAFADDYLQSMERIEAANPDLTVVYCTEPLRRNWDASITVQSVIDRTILNTLIRDYCVAHDKVLFDIADIESWGQNTGGQWQQYTATFTGLDLYGNGVTMTCPMANPAYIVTTDSLHLSKAGSLAVARGMYSLYGQVVPEPGSLSLMAIASMGLLRRRARGR